MEIDIEQIKRDIEEANKALDWNEDIAPRLYFASQSKSDSLTLPWFLMDSEGNKRLLVAMMRGVLRSADANKCVFITSAWMINREADSLKEAERILPAGQEVSDQPDRIESVILQVLDGVSQTAALEYAPIVRQEGRHPTLGQWSSLGRTLKAEGLFVSPLLAVLSKTAG